MAIPNRELYFKLLHHRHLYVRISHITVLSDAKDCNKKKKDLSSIFGRNAIKRNPLTIPITKGVKSHQL